MLFTISTRDEDNLSEIKDGCVPPVSAISSEKSRSCVSTTLPVFLAASTIDLSVASADNASSTRMASCPALLRNRTVSG